MKRTSVVAVAALVLPLVAGSCTSRDNGPSAEDTATHLAEALTAGHLTSLRFDGGSPRQA